MKKARWQQRISNIFLALVLFLGAHGCGEESLGKTFIPDPKPEPEEGDLIPVAVGDTAHFFFALSYKPITSQTESGSTEGEIQKVGNLCLKVTDVQDTATEDYTEASETKIIADTRVVGTAGSAAIVTTPSEMSGADVDAIFAESWVEKLLVPSVDNGMSTATSKTYNTRNAPRPSTQLDLGNLPFFDVRRTEDLSWGGWDTSQEGNKTFTNDLFVYFTETFLANEPGFYSGTNFEQSSKAGLSCEESDASDGECPSQAGCYRNASGVCIGLYTIGIAWNHTLSTGPQASKPVTHRILFEYTLDGILSAITEYILPQQSVVQNPEAYHNQCQANASDEFCFTTSIM
ncbi:MAG: hypothetical protein QGI45_05890, partial [Myxococcota bacterium]|nr:hypothetical protein [Myxococcota bacterium]